MIANEKARTRRHRILARGPYTTDVSLVSSPPSPFRRIAKAEGSHASRPHASYAPSRLAPVPRPRGRPGGHVEIWDLIEHDFMVTLVNTSPWPCLPERLAHRFRIVVADACDLGGSFASGSFDLAFSNSAIEHVGGGPRRILFAREAKRLAPSWWIQTPNPLFPIEAHTGLPFHWQWPDWAKARAEGIRRRHMPEWQEEMAATEPVYEEEMRGLFPGGLTYRERIFGLVKSFALYRPFPA